MARLITAAAVRARDVVEVADLPGRWCVLCRRPDGALDLRRLTGDGSVAYTPDPGRKVVLHVRGGRLVDMGADVTVARDLDWGRVPRSG